MNRRASLTHTPKSNEATSRGADLERPRSIVVLDDDARSPRRGFTIVELLIVVVVIAILAAITIVAYTGINNRAKATAAASAAEQAAKKVMTYAITNGEQYPAALTDAGVSDGSATYQYRVDNSANPSTFCLTATSNSVSYFVSSTNQAPTVGVCAGHAATGQTLTTNLTRNPKVSNDTTGWLLSTLDAGATLVHSVETTGGPLTSVPKFLRRTNSTAFTSSPTTVATSGSGTSAIPIAPDTSYTYSAYFRSSCTTLNSIRIDLFGYNAAGSQIASYSGTQDTFGPSTSWKRISRVASLPSPAAYVSVRVAFSGPQSCAIGTTMDVTGIMVTEGTELQPYADGDSPGWAWNGTENASTSTGPAL